MFLSEIRPSEGSVKKRKRVGRGPGSGHGKTACRGMNGQRSRSGCKLRAGFEGGQMPIQRRLPKRGFTNIFKKRFEIVNIEKLEKIFESGATIDKRALKEANLIDDINSLVKILGKGKLTKSFTVIADAFSESAKEAILKANGKVEMV